MQPVPVVRNAPVSGANKPARSAAQQTGEGSFTALLSQRLSDHGASAQRPQSVTGTSVSVHGPEEQSPHASEGRSPPTKGSQSGGTANSGVTKSQTPAVQTISAHSAEKKQQIQGQLQALDPSQMAGGAIEGGATTAVVANLGTNVSSANGTVVSQPTTKKSSQSSLAGQMGVAALMPPHVWMPPAKTEQTPVPSEAAVGGAAALSSSAGAAGGTGQGSVVQKNAATTTSLTSGNEPNFSLSVGGNGSFSLSSGVGTSGGQGSPDSLAVSLTSPSAHTAPGHSALNGLLMSSSGATVGAETASSSIMIPVGQMGWGTEFSQKVTWMVGQSQQSAELHLNPPDLGPMSVVVQVSGAQADAFFSSPHAAVREAIQHALPHLREMLAGSGLSLGQATVSDQGAQGSPSQRQMARENFSATKRTLEVSSVPMGARGGVIRQGVGLVDTFA
ncbi:Flagellar hook-length control protein [mine drainage metagenome]|uniref:Flagellar hook-length control protein n=1 Tax=mine drainage metagenome TaxID=410659 RepID=A0A3P3ZLU2_9ZZZZ